MGTVTSSVATCILWQKQMVIQFSTAILAKEENEQQKSLLASYSFLLLNQIHLLPMDRHSAQISAEKDCVEKIHSALLQE